jgi:acyl-CoA thioester hydrolase
MAAVFEQHINVTEQDLDDLEHVNNVVYLHWIQDVSKAHWMLLSTPDIRERYAWVVLRHEIDYHRSAKMNEQITLRTWVGETSGFRSVRHVEILNNMLENIVTAQTIWCLIEAKSFKPARINKEILACLLPD